MLRYAAFKVPPFDVRVDFSTTMFDPLDAPLALSAKIGIVATPAVVIFEFVMVTSDVYAAIADPTPEKSQVSDPSAFVSITISTLSIV